MKDVFFLIFKLLPHFNFLVTFIHLMLIEFPLRALPCILFHTKHPRSLDVLCADYGVLPPQR